MDGELVARGTDHVVRFDGRCIKFDRVGGGRKLLRGLQMAFSAWKDPADLVDAFDDERRGDFVNALEDDRELLKQLIAAVRLRKADGDSRASDADDDEETASMVRELLDAISRNRGVVVEAFGEHREDIVKAVRSNQDLVDILLRDYVPKEQFVDLEITTTDSGAGQATFNFLGDYQDRVVTFRASEAASFGALRSQLGTTSLDDRSMADPEEPVQAVDEEELGRLADLLERGLIDEDEYKLLKKRALGLE